ncbi:MAG: tRNA (adenosine(37)-N6)-dimethylallyltransferase MiaA [Acidimicrobiales bacterium]
MRSVEQTVAPLGLAIVGPTASGKTSLACELASSRADVEAVSVDSMAVYRGMDIGTAKPSAAERSLVAWHMVDVLDPSEELSVSSFQRLATGVLDDIYARGHVAVLVGGTGLYLRALLDGLQIPGCWPQIAATLEEESLAPGGLGELYERLERLDPVTAAKIEPNNRRRLVRALEVTIGSGAPFSSHGSGLERYGRISYTILGVRYPPSEQKARIEQRFAKQMEQGFLEEVETLLQRREGLSRTARQALGYRELIEHVSGSCDIEEAVARALQRTREFARRQWRWFRRDPRVRWLDPNNDLLGEAARAADEVIASREGRGSAAELCQQLLVSRGRGSVLG